MPTTRATRRAPAQAGFTLIELMVAIVVSAIVIFGVYAFSTIQRATAGLHQRNVQVQQALEGAMWSVAKDVRAAGLGFARNCTELRVFDPASGTLINPGGATSPGAATLDPFTGEPYWVLRDGLQAHWDSSQTLTLDGSSATSATPDSASDSFDVILGEPTYLGSFGAFVLENPIVAGDVVVTVRTSNALDNTVPGHLAQVQQMFPPGSFIALGRVPDSATIRNPFRPETQGQCVLLQVTNDVAAVGGDPQLWTIGIDPAISGFNAGLTTSLNDNNGTIGTCHPGVTCDDWDPGALDNQGGGQSGIVPLGRLRWSRYEIDYTIPQQPYLVRYDIIGHQPGVDPETLGAVNYPHCNAGTCPAAGLHLPNSASPPLAVAIGPMIEDMQVAVGCDGYTTAGAQTPTNELPPPDAGFEEVGPVAVPTGPNVRVDENAPTTQRDADEWLGNAVNEQWAPDCVFYGTGNNFVAGWIAVEGSQNPPPAFRMSPQSMRVTMVASAEAAEGAGGLSTDQVLAVEDRPRMVSTVGARQRFTLTETFSPKNLRWRDTSAL